MTHGPIGKGWGWGCFALALVACGDSGGDGTGGQTDSDSGLTDATVTTTGTTAVQPTTGPGPTTEGNESTVGASQTGTDSDTLTTVDPTPGTTPTTGDTTSSLTDTTATDDTTAGDDLCEGGTLCGEPAACCPAGNECINDACLPTCESEIRCGPDLEMCCEGGQVCSGDQCVTPGDVCTDSYDCQPGEYCEQTLGQCLPQPDPLLCEVVPNFDTLDAVQEWAWEEEDLLSLPAVADLDGDGLPEVVINTTRHGDSTDFTVGIIIVLDGTTGLEKFRVDHDPAAMKFGSHGRSTVAVGDVSGDGLPDIVYAGREGANNRSPVHAIDGTGNLLWTSHTDDAVLPTTLISNGAATLANFDDDPEAEVVFGATLFDNDGLVVWNQNNNGGGFGSGGNYIGGISAVVDLDADGYPEIVTGKHAWKVSWTPGDPPTVSVAQLWVSAGLDGWPAIADLDQNGSPEVIVAASGTIRVLAGLTGELWCGVDPTGAMCEADPALRTQPQTIPGPAMNNLGGPPTVADFDGDGRPELAVAGATAYTVFDLNRAGEEVVQPMNDPAPAAGAIFRRWSQTTKDQSSNATGSSVFDFQGDGAAEVTYNDECYARVYDGRTGAVLLQIPNSSGTIHEYPLVVDADADGNSEILMTASYVGGCPDPQRHGVFLYGDANDEWVPTRRVWTQHTYHVTNATSAGNPPMNEQDNWTSPGLNNYRQNSQGAGVFNAPDLSVQLAIGLDACLDKLDLIATVRNEGAAGVPAGITVEFFQGLDATGALLGAGMTDKALLPGGSTKVILQVDAPPSDMPADYFVQVDDASNPPGQVTECDELNNSDAVSGAACPMPG